ncbi:MAG TPA: hypothetical protein PLG39_00425 [Methanotrichaceae archaeon]|nr:hypothetical protein [Methanotrichaceae archaeon]
MNSARFILVFLTLLLLFNAVCAQEYCLLRKPQYISDPCSCYQLYLAAASGDAARAASDGVTCYITDLGAREGWEVEPNFGGPHDWTSGDEAIHMVSPYYEDYYGCNDCRSGGSGDGTGGSGSAGNFTKGALLVGPISIPAISTTPTDLGIVLERGKPYIIVGEGTCSLWDGQEDGCDSVYRYNTPLEPNGGELKVWGQLELIDPSIHLSELIEKDTGKLPEYNPSHVYEAVLFGDGKTLKARVFDGGGYSDNHGELKISVYDALSVS